MQPEALWDSLRPVLDSGLRHLFSFSLRAFLLLAFLPSQWGCGYRMGYADRTLPNSYQELAIPVFHNRTDEVGIEAYFTNALIREFERSQVARVTSRNRSEVTLEGSLDQLEFRSSSRAVGGTEIKALPSAAVLTTEYRVLLTTNLRLVRNSDGRVLWQTSLRNEKVFAAPQIGSAGINTANATYLHSARHQTLAQLAEEMMKEAHDRMTENF